MDYTEDQRALADQVGKEAMILGVVAFALNLFTWDASLQTIYTFCFSAALLVLADSVAVHQGKRTWVFFRVPRATATQK